MLLLFGILSFFVGTIVCDRKLEQDLQELKTFTINQLKEIHLRLAEKDERIKMLETIVSRQQVELETKHEETIQQINYFKEALRLQDAFQTEMNIKLRQEFEQVVISLQNEYDKQRAVDEDKLTRLEKRIKILEAVREKPVTRSSKPVHPNKQPQQVLVKDSKIRRQSSDHVAFHTILSGNRCYHNNEVINFNIEEVDSGNNYNVNDGIFDVPFTGTYVFTVTIAGAGHRFATAEIIVNGHIKGTVVADGSDIVNDVTTSTSVIVVHANVGEHVFVRLGPTSYTDCDILSNLTFARTTFSGWLLF